MKKMISILLLMMMALTGGAVAEESDTFLAGRVTGWSDDHFMLDTLDGQTVRVNYGGDTKIEADWEIGEGDVVQVTHTGRMTRSLPPQVYAQTVRSDSVEGFVEEIDAEGGHILINSRQTGQVWMTLPEGENAEDYADSYVRVFFSGVMALSLPAQATAFAVEKMVVETGNVTESGDDFFMIKGENSAFRVNFDPQTKAPQGFAVGDAVEVYYNGIVAQSLPGQIYAVVVVNLEPDSAP